MNIWIVNQFAIPPSQSGGTRHYSLAKEMIREGIHTTIIAAALNYQSGEKMEFEDSSKYKAETYDGVDFLWIRSAFQHSSSGLARVAAMVDFFARLLSRNIRKNLQAPNLIIGSTPQPFAALGALFLAKRLQVPFVLEVRDLWPDSLLDLGGYAKWHPFILLLRVVEMILYRCADEVITLLPLAEGHIRKLGGGKKPITWIPNGVGLSEFSIDEGKGGDGRSPFVIIYAGAHGLANGLDTLLDAAKVLRSSNPEVLFQLIGDGPQKERLLERKCLEDISNVEFYPPISKSEIPRKLSTADAFYMPLRQSPVFRWGISPNKLFDYMAAARPVIFAVDTDFNPVKKSDAGVSIPAESPQELVKAIQYLASLPNEERRKLGRNGRKYIVENHDHSVLAGRLTELIRRITEIRGT